ncbi:MAG: NAD-dependent epimerase/dehydratase family protein [Planctomycetes bacterium]|nr:NAD-dependent epimerase/dehydratase family protein [Planctomycetota bacterium]
MSAPILITGATGFVGGELARILVGRGLPVHAFARAQPTSGSLTGLPITWHLGELEDARSVDAAVASAGAGARVIHSGALISYASRDTQRAHAINVEGTRHVLAACKRHRSARLCFVSSVVAVGPSPDGSVLDESSPFHGAHLGVDYMSTKRAAEELVLASARELDVVVANPGAVIGPAERKSNTVEFLRQLAAGKRPIAAPPGSIAVVGIRDTAEGILLVLERGRRGERYLLFERCVRTRELFTQMGAALGQPGLKRTLPRALWPLVVGAARLVDRIHPLELTPPQALVMLGQELQFSNRKAREELGWKPMPLEEVLAHTVAVLRERGVLPAPLGVRSAE